MTASNGTPTSKTKPSSVEDSQLHEMGKIDAQAINKATASMAKKWRELGAKLALLPDNTGTSKGSQCDILNAWLQGFRETLSRDASKNLGRDMGELLSGYRLARCKKHGNDTPIPDFYQVAGSNEKARFQVNAKPEKAKPAKTDAPKEATNHPQMRMVKKPKPSRPKRKKSPYSP